MAEAEEDKVRVGDRYIDGDRRITITEIQDGRACYSVMRSDTGAIWSAWTAIPLPPRWDKAGTGPAPRQMCIKHPIRDVEPGLIYCPECVDQGAAQWSKFSLDEAQDMTAMLLKDAEEKR